MNKAELIDFIAKHADLTKADANRSLDAFVTAVTHALITGDSVTLIGFGTFDVADRQEREGRNPRTGEPITIPSSKVAKFKPGKALRESLNPVEAPKKAAAKKAKK
jgi:DNA-binding protein HU-beta